MNLASGVSELLLIIGGVFQKALKIVDREEKAKKAQKAPGGHHMGNSGIYFFKGRIIRILCTLKILDTPFLSEVL